MDPSSPHGATRNPQRAPGGGTYAKERQKAAAALRAAGLTETQINTALQKADAYFKDKLGVRDETPTRIPRDRSNKDNKYEPERDK